jgi:two-component system OmpR family sensor kinase
LLCALWLGGSALALLGLRHETAEVLDASLAETAQRLLVLPEGALGRADAGQLSAEIGEHEELVIYQIYDHQGRLRLRSHAAPDSPLDPNDTDGVREIGNWRVLTLTRDDDQRRAQVAELIDHRRHALWAGSSWLVGTLLAMLPIVALTLHLVLRRAFRGLERTRRGLEARSAHELGPLPDNDIPDELRPWLGTVNTLMQRVQHLVDAERAFAAHTAHELRTPLAAARAQAQRLAHETREPKVIERAQALVRQLDRLTTLATRLLQIARIESGVALKREPVDLDLLASIVADEFTEARSNGTLQIRSEGTGPHEVAADIDALGIALRNLIDNALKHGHHAEAGMPALQVRIDIGPNRLGVTDNGPGVPAETLPRLTRPFERGETPHDGSGLGLAMVATIARQSGAHLKIESPAESGRGLRVTLRFNTSRCAPGLQAIPAAAGCQDPDPPPADAHGHRISGHSG